MCFGTFIHFRVSAYGFEDYLVIAPKLSELETTFLEEFHKFLRYLDCFFCRGEGIQIVVHIKLREDGLSCFRKLVVVVVTCTLKRVVRAGRRIFAAKNMPHVLVDYHICSGGNCHCDGFSPYEIDGTG